jgi:hypothetical protein
MFYRTMPPAPDFLQAASDFMRLAVEYFESTPWIERYAWWPLGSSVFDGTTALYSLADNAGSPTELGRLYRDLPIGARSDVGP